MIFIHAADLHLGSPLGGLDKHDQLPVQQIRQAPMRAFERLADLCIKEEAELLLIAGDLFDGNADLATMREAVQILERIARSGTRVATIRGNHDAESKMERRMPQIDNVFQLPTSAPGTVAFDDIGIVVHGQGFDTPRVESNIVTGYPAPVAGMMNVGLLHTSLSGAPGHDPYAPCSVSDLDAKGYQYWALGHVHKRQVISSQPWIIYPGNTQGRDVGETGPRGATVVEYQDGHVVGEPKHVDLDEVRWSLLRVEIDPDETAEDLIGRICALLSSEVQSNLDVVHLARLVVSGRGEAHQELMANPGAWIDRLHAEALEVSADRLYIEQVKLRTSPRLDPPDVLMNREDFVGDVARLLLARSPDSKQFDVTDGFATLEKKLSKLSGGQAGGLMESVHEQEVTESAELLVSRLVVAQALANEEAR